MVGKYLREISSIKNCQSALLDGYKVGRKRKRVVHIPKKRLPKFFSCPKCGKETVEVKISRDQANATVGCSSCGLTELFPIKIAQTEVDIYCMLTDKVFSSSKKIGEDKKEDI